MVNFMIFVTVGSQKFQFNRLLKALDKLVGEGKIKDSIFAQIGYSTYIPKNYRYKAFLNRNEFISYEKEANIVITHGGTGAIIGAVKAHRKVIAVPRLKKFGEHVDNHQLQILAEFKQLNIIDVCKNCDNLDRAIREVKKKEFKEYKSNTDTIINSIGKFIDNRGIQ